MIDHRRLPFDLDIERSVLAEVAEPLHVVASMREVVAEHFHDARHRRIATSLLSGGPLGRADRAYLADAVRYAWPLTASTLPRFFELAAARARLLELAGEIERVLWETAA